MSLAEVVFDAVIAAKDHAGDQAEQLLCFGGQRAFRIGVRVQVPEPFYNEIVLAKDQVVHFTAVVIKFFYQAHFLNFKGEVLPALGLKNQYYNLL